MTEADRRRASKFMSMALRHQPEVIGLNLDVEGYVPVDDLLKGMRRKGFQLQREDLDEIVETNDKKRFSFSKDGTKIRAAQGHSVDLEGSTVQERKPPDVLYHGTAEKTAPLIDDGGLRPMSRIHVHLSLDVETAIKVGSRRGRPVIFKVLAAKAHREGYRFYLAENGVWLTDSLPPDFLERVRS